MILLYILLQILLGYSFINVLHFFKIIDKSKISFENIIAFLFPIGTLIFTVYMFLIGFLNIKYSFYLFYPIIINGIVVLIILTRKIIISKNITKKTRNYINKKITQLKQKNKLIIVIDLVIWLFIVLFITDGLANYLKFPDEFSHWGIQARNIFESGQMNTFTPTKNEIYPNFLPLLYSGFYYFSGGIQENMIRIFQALFLISLYFNLISFCKEKKLNLSLLKLLFCLLLTGYAIIGDISSSSYADISFMYFYSLSSLYLIDWVFFRKNNNNIVLSAILLVGALWTKRDGLYLVLFTYSLLFFYRMCRGYLNLKKISWKTICIYIATTIFIPMFWILYTKLHSFPTDLSNFDLRLDYFVPMMSAINKQLYTDLFTSLMIILVLKTVLFEFQLFNSKKQLYLLSLLSYVIVNIMFLVICYLSMFGGEGPIAASFIRYISRIIPMLIIFVVISKSENNFDDKENS